MKSPEIVRLELLKYLDEEMLPLVASKSGRDNYHYKKLEEIAYYLRSETALTKHFYFARCMKCESELERVKTNFELLKQQTHQEWLGI